MLVESPRILLTGHSHQAWPDVAAEGLREAFDDAARHVDDKWSAAFERAEVLRGYVAEQLVGASPDEIALGQNTHELVSRFLSALDFARRPRLVASTGEFHSLDRQLRRLAEAGALVELIAAEPAATLSARLADALDERTAAVMVSSVLFESSSQVHGLAGLGERAAALGVELLVDAYHGFGVLPLSLAALGGERAFVTGGGYKYAQWGEGCCFLRVPKSSELRPVYTGWFSDFAGLEAPRDGVGVVTYGALPHQRFAGSTYDPTSHYRAARVVRFFCEQGLGISRLRALSLHQTERLMSQLEQALGPERLLTPRAPGDRAGFVAVLDSQAKARAASLRDRGVWVDARGAALRFGPAPYTLDSELDEAVARYLALVRAG
ncbi:MAG: kynureninase [Polyangiaceae bacterium]|nr:kynureninase [Polyangiaceae bacterium]